MGACMHLNGLPALGLNDLVRMLIPCLQCGCMQSCVLTPTCFSRPSQPSLSLGPALMVKRGIFWTVWTVLDPKESAMRPRIDRLIEGAFVRQLVPGRRAVPIPCRWLERYRLRGSHASWPKSLLHWVGSVLSRLLMTWSEWPKDRAWPLIHLALIESRSYRPHRSSSSPKRLMQLPPPQWMGLLSMPSRAELS